MIKYHPTTFDTRFKPITVSVEALDELARADSDPTYIRAGGRVDDRLPWHVQALHASRYYDRLGDIEVDRMARRPVLRLSDKDERREGRAPVIVVDELETLAALRDAGSRWSRSRCFASRWSGQKKYPARPRGHTVRDPIGTKKIPLSNIGRLTSREKQDLRANALVAADIPAQG